jgi:hypothetical protein
LYFFFPEVYAVDESIQFLNGGHIDVRETSLFGCVVEDLCVVIMATNGVGKPNRFSAVGTRVKQAWDADKNKPCHQRHRGSTTWPHQARNRKNKQAISCGPFRSISPILVDDDMSRRVSSS